PLKRMPEGEPVSAKTRRSVQHTQKSFSTITGLMPRRSADARKRSARSPAGSLATSSTDGVLPCLCDHAGRVGDPTFGVAGAAHELAALVGAEAAAERHRGIVVDPAGPRVAEGVKDELDRV